MSWKHSDGQAAFVVDYLFVIHHDTALPHTEGSDLVRELKLWMWEGASRWGWVGWVGGLAGFPTSRQQIAKGNC